MNKFLSRVKEGGRKVAAPKRKSSLVPTQEDLEALEQFAADWMSLEGMRRKTRRSQMYAWGDQWGDLVRDPDTGSMITEKDLIMKQGKVALKNNMIAPIVSNIEGQFRTNTVKPICVVRDQREAKLGEMMSMAVEYVHDINEMQELDANTLKGMLPSGVMAQRLEFGANPAKGNRTDVWAYPVQTPRLFFDTSVEDPRMWDITRIGEIYDLSLEEVIATFGKYVSEEELRRIYGDVDKAIHRDYNSLDGDKLENLNFYTPAQPNMCRVILGWRLEKRHSLHVHDWLRGTWDFVPRNKKAELDAENERRREEALANGVLEEKILYIDYEEEEKSVWVFRYMSPYGHCFLKGDSPYWHGEHNFVLGVQHFVNGKLYNFIEQFIDQQRIINRTAMMIDFIRSTSSKGVLIVNEEAFDSMDREEIVEEYVRYNGVMFVKPKAGVNVRDVVFQMNGNASVAGDYELLNLQLKLINEISGVNTAMQGHNAPSGTPSSLYAQQAQNSSLNLKGLFGALTAFRRRRDTKLMQMIQQFYNDRVYLDIAGTDYSEEAKWYNPEKAKNAVIDLSLTDGNNSPAYQMLQNDFAFQLFQAGAIDVKSLLENTTYPFATRLLEGIKRNEADAQQAMAQYKQEAQGAMTQPLSPQMQMAMNNGNAGEQDGLIRRA